MIRRPPRSTLFPYTRSSDLGVQARRPVIPRQRDVVVRPPADRQAPAFDRKLHEALFSVARSEEHTSELQSRQYLVCRLLLEKKKISPPVPTRYHIELSAFTT